MKNYQKGLIILSAIFILPSFAFAVDTPEIEELEVTMTVVESPEDSAEEITNRIEIPTGEYLMTRDRTRTQDRLHDTGSGQSTNEETRDMTQEQRRDMIREHQDEMTREMIQEHQDEATQEMRQEMMRDHFDETNSQVRENTTDSMGGNNSGRGRGGN